MSQNNVHLYATIRANEEQGQVIRRHLDNLVTTYGRAYVIKLVLSIFNEEIKAKTTKQTKVG